MSKMLVLVMCCMFFIIVSPASAANYYISKSGNNQDGTSWTSAWNEMDQVNWSVIKPGDVLEIDGGSSSMTYTKSLTLPLGHDNLTIKKGSSAGHNGEAILDGLKTTAKGISINARGSVSQNISISGLTFKAFTNAGIYGDGQTSGGMQNITVDNCRFIDFRRAGVFFEGNNNVTGNKNIIIKNSYFNDDNTYSSQSDGIYVQVLNDFTADHNHIILDNNYTATEDLHSDNIQAFLVDNVTYSNNILVQSSNKTLGTQMLFTEDGNGMQIFVNNVLYRNVPKAADSAIRLKKNSGTYTGKIIGNTYYGMGRPINSSVQTEIKNNIIYGVTSGNFSSSSFYTTASGSYVSNNLFYDMNNNFSNATGGIEQDPKFVNTTYNVFDLHIQSSSPAVNAGVNLGSTYGVDIEGKSRGTSWDIGAYEYGTSTNNPTVTSNPQATVTSIPGNTRLNLTVLLHGIGKGGDNVNATTVGNLAPLHTSRQVTVELLNPNNQLVTTKQGTVTFSNSSGDFRGTIEIGTIANGVYTARVKIPQFLRRNIAGITQLQNGQVNTLAQTALVTGDTNNDNALSVLDYNMLLDCFADLSQPRNCADANKKLMTDLTDDGKVNQFDYNLFLRELSVQSGQ